jgi:DEAD/DEAH box helicase domain-containing protein
MKNLSFDFSVPSAGPIVLDVETQYLSDEVPGGWGSVDKFRIAMVVTWDQPNGIRVWFEEDVPRLLHELENFDPVVTFNGEGFDFKVLSAYGPVDSLYKKSMDMLAKLSRQLGFRIKLETLAQATLGRGKSGSGTDCVGWWRSGDPVLRQKAVDYCKMDVELTRDIYQFAKQNAYLLIDDVRQSMRRRVDVVW